MHRVCFKHSPGLQLHTSLTEEPTNSPWQARALQNTADWIARDKSWNNICTYFPFSTVNIEIRTEVTLSSATDTNPLPTLHISRECHIHFLLQVISQLFPSTYPAAVFTQMFRVIRSEWQSFKHLHGWQTVLTLRSPTGLRGIIR
jgi:hypothetical protein